MQDGSRVGFVDSDSEVFFIWVVEVNNKFSAINLQHVHMKNNTLLIS